MTRARSLDALKDNIEGDAEVVEESRDLPSSEEVTITVSRLAPSLNGGKGLIRMHWSDYREIRDQWAQEVSLCAAEAVEPPARVEIVRYYARNPLDVDNMFAAAKVPIDALCHVGVLPDDDPDSITRLDCSQEKVESEDEERTEIRVQSISLS